MIDQLVRTYPGVPPASVFANRSGTPIVLNDTTGDAYALIGGVVTLINSATLQSLTASRLTSQSPVTLSGTTTTISTTIPSWVRQIILLFNAASINATSDYLVQIGGSSIETSGYVSESQSGTTVDTSTSGFIVLLTAATNSHIGQMTMTSVGNTWIESHLCRISTTALAFGAGSKTLSDTLTSIQITTVSGNPFTFDAGTITVLYQ